MKAKFHCSLAHYMAKDVELNGLIQHFIGLQGFAILQLMVDDTDEIRFDVIDDVFKRSTNAKVKIFDVLKIVNGENAELPGERFGAMSFSKPGRYHTIESAINTALCEIESY